MTSKIPHKLRALRESDIAYVRDSWVRQYAKAAVVHARSPLPGSPRPKVIACEPHAPLMDKATYERGQYALVAMLLMQWPCVIACATDNEDEILGYVCGGNGVVHWVSVRHGYRSGGLGTTLWQIAVDQATSPQVSHCPRRWPSFAKNATYNPYAILLTPEALS